MQLPEFLQMWDISRCLLRSVEITHTLLLFILSVSPLNALHKQTELKVMDVAF